MKSLFTTIGLNVFSAHWCKAFIILIIITACSNTGLSQTLWIENWEGNWITDWHVDAGTWEVGTPTSGPNSAYNGQNCAATVLAGNYSEPVDSRLIRHSSFVVPSASQNPRLRFWHWYSFSDNDYGIVQIKVNDGNWQDIYNNYNRTGSGVWTYPSIDLSAFADSTVQIAFYFHSQIYGSATDVSSGWYIDDVKVITGPIIFNNPEDFESGIGEWASERGTWEIGEPTAGPISSYSLPNCAGTVLDGNYAEPVDSRLISAPFVLPGISENPGLSFWHWYSFSTSDYGAVQIKVNNGTWITISNQFTSTSSNVWTPFYIPLSAYADSTVQIAFYFHSQIYGSATDVSSGWYIDEINIVPYIVSDADVINENVPLQFHLSQNYPNPFNPTTKINYSITKTSFVTIRIYDALGSEVTSMINEEKPAGSYEINFDASSLSSGIYFYKLQAGNFVETRKMVLLR